MQCTQVSSIERMPTDLVVRIYTSIDLEQPSTVEAALHAWIRDHLSLGSCVGASEQLVALCPLVCSAAAWGATTLRDALLLSTMTRSRTSHLIGVPRRCQPGPAHGDRRPCCAVADAHYAGVGILHSLRSCRLRSVVEDLRARGVRPHHVGCIHEILLVLVGLADEEHFAVTGHDPAVELAVDGTVDLELDHGCWFSSSCMPGGAHQRRVIRGRRAVFSQQDLITVIILMSKLRTHRIGRPIRRYEPTDRRAGPALCVAGRSPGDAQQVQPWFRKHVAGWACPPFGCMTCRGGQRGRRADVADLRNGVPPGADRAPWWPYACKPLAFCRLHCVCPGRSSRDAGI